METCDLRICDIQSGGLHNAIPRDGWAVCAVPMHEKETVRVALNHYLNDLEGEIGQTEPQFKFTMESISPVGTCLEPEGARRMLLSFLP